MGGPTTPAGPMFEKKRAIKLDSQIEEENGVEIDFEKQGEGMCIDGEEDTEDIEEEGDISIEEVEEDTELQEAGVDVKDEVRLIGVLVVGSTNSFDWLSWRSNNP